MRWVGGIAMGMVCVALVPARLAAQVPPGCVSTSDPEIVTSPPNGASDVAINTPIQIRVQDDDQPLFALYRGLSFETQTPVAARWQRFGNTEQFAVVPEALLEPDTDYTIRIRTRTGLDESRSFTTSDVIDTQPPEFSFGPDNVIDYSSSRLPESCGAEDGSYRVTINVEGPNDDGADGSVELFLYLTRATGLDAPTLMKRIYNQGDQNPITFVLTPEQVATAVCVTVDAVDGVGNHADSIGIEEFCFDPLQGNFFEPCAVTRGPWRSGHQTFAFTIAIAWLALSVRFRRLRRSSQR